MREIYSFEFEGDELPIIKTALIQFNKRSKYYEKAQTIAAQIHVVPIHEGKTHENRKEGLSEDILRALSALKEATSPEIEEYLRLPKPNSVATLCSRLAQKGVLEIKENDIATTGNRRGVAAKHRYSIKQSKEI